MDSGVDLSTFYIPPDFALMVNEWKNGADKGMPSRVEALNDVFAWKTGFINGWYGYANDGKSTFFDYMAVLAAHFDGQKFCMFRQEDMNSYQTSEGVKVNGNDIYNNLIWVKTGKTPYRHIHEKYQIPLLTLQEYADAEEWVREHFFIVFSKDRRHQFILDRFAHMHAKFKINHFLIDPFKSLILRSGKGLRSDEILNAEFIDGKQFALETKTSLNYIAHPKSMEDVKVSKKEDAPFKVVTQFHVAGGAAWDNNMDSQFSIYRPERHMNAADPKVHFYNLKQRKAELVGVKRGVFKNIEFDWTTKGYFFDGVNPLTGKRKEGLYERVAKQGDIFDTSETKGTKSVKEEVNGFPF